jgi:hypothetical protein
LGGAALQRCDKLFFSTRALAPEGCLNRPPKHLYERNCEPFALGDTIIQAAHATACLEVSLMLTPRFIALLAACAMCAFSAYAQDSQSVADAARQSRLQKQQKDAKDATTKDTPATATPAQPLKPKVITNEDLPEHAGPTVSSSRTPQTQSPTPAASHADYLNAVAEKMKSQIESQKAAVASLEAEIAGLNESVRYAGANCVANCVEWNERQKEKQDRVIVMQHQLEDQKQHLADLQESARKQGFGSAITDP